jgi:plasmid stabilization system protein ParE
MITANKNFDEAMEYIAQDNPEAALSIYKHTRRFVAVSTLAMQPHQGRSGRVYGTRELIIGKYPYIIPYRAQGEEIQILRVFHTSRKPPTKW